MKLKVSTYEQPTAGYVGYVEPEDRSWILFVAQDGGADFFGSRDENGGVL